MNATHAEKQSFRLDVQKLKKMGIVPKWIKTNTVLPSQIIHGPRGGSHTLQSIVTRMDPVLSKKATPVTLDQEGVEYYRKQGYEIADFKGAKTRVIVPHSVGESIKVKDNRIERIPSQGLHITQLPIEYQNIDQYLRDLKRLNQHAPTGSYYGFNFYGGNSHVIFSNTKFLAEYFQHYKKRFTQEQWRKSFPQFEMITLTNSKKWLKETSKTTYFKKHRKKGKKR